MTHHHAAVQLLRLGPLSLADFADITGWDKRACTRLLHLLVKRRRIRPINHDQTRHYVAAVPHPDADGFAPIAYESSSC